MALQVPIHAKCDVKRENKCALMLGLGQRFFLYRVFFKRALKDHLCSKLFLPPRRCTSVQCIPTQQG